MQNKKAAMFGLDARIALAIFGALSVITGAALYSAISAAKEVAKITTLENLSKAIDAYLLDTGLDIPIHPGSTNFTNGGELISSSESGWQGPYISLDYTAAADDKSGGFSLNKDEIAINTLSDLAWTPSFKNCSAGGNCYYWIAFSILDKKSGDLSSEFKKFDLRIDGSDTPTSGKFRYVYMAGGDATRGYLQGPPTLAK